MLTRQRGGSGVIKGSANERLSGVNVLTYLSRARGERSFIPRGQTVSLFDCEVSKVQKVMIKDTGSWPLGWDPMHPEVRGHHRNAG